ncbi:hypothetical protein ACIOGX_13960 [Streptomyces sp. NPDC088147]|uniref:hypothetical protein n=1 Tax=unclassified Streptomyces TaxID=2593676 RepID=UPI00101DF862|nr:hypothetical protein [Streptomyces sp. L-9-10]RYJ30407.1 hypothetical protein CU044_1142 [Streptomyces sp. L-9-10]
MPPEGALLESRTMRDSVVGRVEALDKVKALRLLHDGVHIATEGVARYFEVSTDVIRQLTARHRAELSENGMHVLRGSDLREYQSDKMSLSSGGEGSYPQRRSSLTLYTRRAVLNIAMLLRDSDIARCVRTYLLDAEHDLRKGYADLDRRVTDVEACLGGVGVALRELGPVLNRMSYRLDSLDRRLDATNRVVAAISNRLCEMSADIHRVDARVDDVVHQLRDLRRGRKRR